MFKIIPTLLLLLFFNSYGQSGLPVRWSSTSAYSAGDLVISNGNTYLALRDVQSGTPITSNLFWVSLDTQVPSSTSTPDLPRDASGDVVTPDVAEVAYLSNPNSTKNFYHGFKHLDQTGADKYLIEQSGIKKYSEWQNPPLTYFGPSANNKPSTLTYKYSFEGAVQSAKARISLSVWNFNAPGAYGSGSGQASAWASKDGTNWERILDLPTPSTFSAGKTFEEYLPTRVLGSNDLYLQIRMEVSGAPNTSYTTAQFGRSDANANKDIFYLNANYSSDEENPFNPIPPRPNTFLIESIHNGSTTDVDNLEVTDLDTGQKVYINNFSTAEDATRELILHHYPISYKDGNNYVTNGEKTRLVNEKLRLETTGFLQNGSGGTNSSSMATFTGGLPKNFLIEFDAKRLQWAGWFQFRVFYQDPTDSPAHYADGGFNSSNRESKYQKLIFNIAADGSQFRDYGVSHSDDGRVLNFNAPSGSLLDNHRLGISLNGNTVSFYMDGNLLNSGDISEYLRQEGETIDLSSGLVAWYPFDGNASDMSGNGNDGTVYGATLGEDRNGEAGKAYEFDGVNDWIDLNNKLITENFTLSLWTQIDLNHTVESDEQGVVLHSAYYNGRGLITFYRAEDYLSLPEGLEFRFHTGTSLSNQKTSYDEGEITDFGNWNNLVITHTNGAVTYFYNSSLAKSVSVSSFVVTNSYPYTNNGETIGKASWSNGSYFKGSIDDVRIYNRALSEAEVQALYELEKPRFNMAECMQHLPTGSLIAIPAGANAPSGLSLVQQGQSDGFDLYKVDGLIPVNDSFAVGASEVIKNPSKFGLFTQEDLNSTQDAAKKEGENMGKSLGEYSVINNPAVYGLFSQSAHYQAIADINTSAHASGVISGRESVLADPTGHNLIGLSAHTQAIADINTSAHSSGVISGRESVLIDPYSYNLISRIEYDQMAKSLRMPDTNATPHTDGWFYIPDHGWLWTINQAYPWFYDANSSDWLYFKQGGSQPRFYEYASKKWVEWADFVKQPWDSHYEGWLKNPEPYGGANVLGLIKKAKNEQKTKLDLGDYHVKDLAPLSGLKHLTALNIGDNDITDISVLSQMNGLTRLVLKDNKNLVDLHPLADLSNLEELDLMYNDLSQLDLTPLYQLSNLRILRVSDYLVSFSQMNALQEKLPNSQILFVEGEDFDWSN